MSRIKNRMYPLAKPFVSKQLKNQIVLYNPKTKQVVIMMETTKNIPKYLEKVN